LLFVAILVVYSYAQGDEGEGCCFYASKHFKDPIGCSDESFKATKPIQSWFCTPRYAANLVKQKTILAPVLCGDTLPETSRAVDADEIHIFTPCPRFSDCCFYTEENMRGEETCIPGTAPAPDKLFKSYTCLPGWRPKVKGGKDLPCPRPGVAVSFAAAVKHGDLETGACEAAPDEPLAATVFEAGTAFSDLESEFNGDASALAEDQPVEDTNFFAIETSNGAPVENLEVTAETENLALEGDAALATVEEANFVEEGDGAAFATVEEANFVELAEGDLGVAGTDETVVQQSGSTSVMCSALICLLAAIFLA